MNLKCFHPATVFTRLWLPIVVLSLPTACLAQYTSTTNNNGTINIGKYTGTGGAVSIPGTINNRVVTSIGPTAFIGVSNLTSVVLPATITNIGYYAFSYCDNLKAITAATQNPDFSTVNGVLFNKKQTTLVEFPNGLAGTYAVPGNVISIANEAFAGSLYLTNISIPAGTTNIGYNMFQLCSALKTMTVATNNLFYSSLDGSYLISCKCFRSPSRLAGLEITPFPRVSSLSKMLRSQIVLV
jgi:hypothetical protein